MLSLASGWKSHEERLQWPHIYCISGAVLALLSQTGPLPDVALSPTMGVGKDSRNCNSRSRERTTIGSTRQGQVLRKGLRINVLFRMRLANLEPECAKGPL